MLKIYQIKSFITLVSILIIGTSLFGEQPLTEFSWLDFLVYSFRITIVILSGWLINGYFLAFRSSRNIGYKLYVPSIALSMIAVFTLDYLLYLIMPHTPSYRKDVGYDTYLAVQHHIGASFFVSLICYIVFYSTHTNGVLQDTKIKNEVLEQNHLRAQLISLQQQISPHFLFNSLSTLRTIATDKPTKDYVMQLSSVYRYVLNYNDRYLTPLAEELAFIKSYLYILNERFEDTLIVKLDMDDAGMELLIPSLSLQLLVENAIKHNTISPEQPLHISITTANNANLTVANTYQPKKVREQGTGMGLKNIAERYKLLLNKEITVVKNAEKFSVTIPLISA